ncbi:MAG TPA: lysophospholipid acyltransferase family protein [Acidobacteriaceae bacterium]
MRPAQLSLASRLSSNLLRVPPFAAATIVCGSLALLSSFFEKKGKPGRLQHAVAHCWAKLSIWISGARVEVSGLENIPAETAVYACNHTSYMDTPVVFSGLPFQFRILAKKELWGIPFIGWYLNRSGQIPIDTANPRTTLSSFGKGVHALRDGLNVFVFPEGGRTPDRQLKPLLNGAAFLALRAQVPIVPIILVGVYDLLPIHTKHVYPDPKGEPIKLVFGKPIPTTGRSPREAEALTAELREAMQALLDANGGNLGYPPDPASIAKLQAQPDPS